MDKNNIIEEKYKSLLSKLNRIYYTYYSYLIDKGKYKELVFKEIERIINDKQNSISIEELLLYRLKEKSKYKTKELLNDEEKSVKLLNIFINLNFKNNDYNSIVKNISKLSNFLLRHNYIPSYDIVTKLFNENEIIQNSIKMVFENNKIDIIYGKLEELFQNPLIISLIELYIDKNNIKIKESSTTYDEKLLGTDTYKLYIADISKHPLLSHEEEIDLATILKYNNKDSKEYKEAKERFVNGNLRIVISIAKKYCGRGLSFMDLIQEGNIGLLTAVDKFDVDKGNRFVTYATWWIRQAITKAIANKGRTIRIPIDVLERLYVYNGKLKKLKIELNREPTIDDIIEKLGYKRETIENYNRLQNKILSLNDYVGDEKNTELGDLISLSTDNVSDQTIEKVDKAHLLELVEKYFGGNSAKEKRTLYIITRRFGLDGDGPETLENIGKNLGVSRERVRQIEAEAIKRIKNNKRLLKLFADFTDNPEKAIKNSTTLNYGGEGEKKMKKHNIYEYLNNYSKESIDKVLSELNDEEKKLITRRFGNDLNNPVQNTLEKSEYNKLYCCLIPKIKRRLSKLERIEGINDKLEKNNKKNELTKTQVKEKITKKQKIEMLSEYLYGNNKEEKENLVFENKPSEIENNNNNGKDLSISKDEAIKILELLRSPSYNELTNNFTPKEAIIVGLKLGYVDGKCFTTESIAGFLGISEEEVIESTKKILLLYKERLVGFIDSAIEVATNKKKELLISSKDNK